MSIKHKFLSALVLIVSVLWVLSLNFQEVKEPVYGVSFSKFHSDELELNWKEVYLALLNDVKVRNFRFSAHWPLTEPEPGKYNFSEEQQYYYNFLVGPASRENNAISAKLERTFFDKWHGLFIARTFVSISKKIS